MGDVHAQHSSEPHPLLIEDLLTGNYDDREDALMVLEETPITPPTADLQDVFGTLSISDHGVSRFFGPTGGSEVRVKS